MASKKMYLTGVRVDVLTMSCILFVWSECTLSQPSRLWRTRLAVLASQR